MQDRREKYRELRERYPEFIYHGYTLEKKANGLRLTYDFEIPGLCRFRPQAQFPDRPFISLSGLDDTLLDTLAFHIGLIELVSYWKATCSPRIIIKPYRLDAPALRWWRYLYFQGQGEFFYLNGLQPDPDDFVELICDAERNLSNPVDFEGRGTLVPIGGGKDSVVSLELLRKYGAQLRPLIMNPRGATLNSAAAAGFGEDDCLVIRRTIDPELLRLNAEGFLNGHTPFSAMLAFYSLLAAVLSGHQSIALSNEASANEATIPGTGINHQYSKSFEFETNFRQYTEQYIVRGIDYFSFLRPLHELQIARLFSRYPQYFPVFRSCNAGSKTDSWCGACAKCLFAYIILSPYLDTAQLTGIFGRDLLDDPQLQSYFDELCGYSDNKPFECIGTVEEVRLALELTAVRRDPPPRLLQHFLHHPAYETLSSATAERIIHGLDPDHHLSAGLSGFLKNELL